MHVQTQTSFPSFDLTSIALRGCALKELKMESDRKNIINKEMVADILMLVLVTVAPILIAWI